MINDILVSEEDYLNMMKESQEYKDASDTEKEYMVEQWKMEYEDYVNARKSGAWWEHYDLFDYGTGKKTSYPKKGGNENNGDPTITEIKGWHV